LCERARSARKLINPDRVSFCNFPIDRPLGAGEQFLLFVAMASEQEASAGTSEACEEQPDLTKVLGTDEQILASIHTGMARTMEGVVMAEVRAGMAEAIKKNEDGWFARLSITARPRGETGTERSEDWQERVLRQAFCVDMGVEGDIGAVTLEMIGEQVRGCMRAAGTWMYETKKPYEETRYGIKRRILVVVGASIHPEKSLAWVRIWTHTAYVKEEKLEVVD